MTIASLLSKILKDKPFFDSSGGGVTLSGGEPLLNMGFASKLLAELKKENIHTLIETSGAFDFSAFEQKILPYTDTVYMDIKLIDPNEHKRHCGISNDLILKNFKHLMAADNAGNLTFLPRLPLIPGITDTAENLEGILKFLKANQCNQLQVLPYNPLWVDKCLTNPLWIDSKINIGSSASPEPDEVMKKFMSEEKIAYCKAIFSSSGIDVL